MKIYIIIFYCTVGHIKVIFEQINRYTIVYLHKIYLCKMCTLILLNDHITNRKVWLCDCI